MGRMHLRSTALRHSRPLRKMVLNSVVSDHSKRNYAKALDEVFALCEECKQPYRASS